MDKFNVAIWFFFCVYVLITLIIKMRENLILDLVFKALVILGSALLYAFVLNSLWLEVLLLGMVISTFLHKKIATGVFILGYGFVKCNDVKVISICIALIVGYFCGMERKDYISLYSAK